MTTVLGVLISMWAIGLTWSMLLALVGMFFDDASSIRSPSANSHKQQPIGWR